VRSDGSCAPTPRSPLAGPEQIAAAKKIAVAKSIGYQTQLRRWMAEGIRREAKQAWNRASA